MRPTEEHHHRQTSGLLCGMKEIGAADRHEVGGRLNNRAENSHQPFRRRERAMQRFRSMKTLQKFSSVHAQVHNHFNQERYLVPGRFTSRDARSHWRSGAPLQGRASLARGRVALRIGDVVTLTTPGRRISTLVVLLRGLTPRATALVIAASKDPEVIAAFGSMPPNRMPSVPRSTIP
jgi:DDE domain